MSLRRFPTYHREYHVPRNDNREGALTQKEQQRNAGDKEDILYLISFPTPMFEFQSKQGQLAYEKVGTQQHQKDNTPHGIRRVYREQVETAYQRGPHQCVGRGRQTDKRGRLTFVKVELSKTQRRESGHDIRDEREIHEKDTTR